jgi:hypothetical protein
MRASFSSLALLLLLGVAGTDAARACKLRIASEPGVRILVDGEFRGVTSTEDGGLCLPDLEPGPHRIEARMPGFRTKTLVVILSSAQTYTEVIVPSVWMPLDRAERAGRDGIVPARFRGGRDGTLPDRKKKPHSRSVRLGFTTQSSTGLGEVGAGFGGCSLGGSLVIRPSRYFDFGILCEHVDLPVDIVGWHFCWDGLDYHEMLYGIERIEALTLRILLRGIFPMGPSADFYAGITGGFGWGLDQDYYNEWWRGGGSGRAVFNGMTMAALFVGMETRLGGPVFLGWEFGAEMCRLDCRGEYSMRILGTGIEDLSGTLVNLSLRMRIGFCFG